MSFRLPPPLRRAVRFAGSFGPAALLASAAFSCADLSDPIREPSRAPVLETRGDTTLREGDSLALVFTATTPFQLGTVYSIEAEHGTVAPSGREWTWQPGFDQAGTHRVRVIAHVPGHPEWADTLTFHVIVVDEPNTGPVFEALRDTTILEAQTLALDLMALDPQGTGVAYSMQGPEGAVLAHDAFTWTPTFTQAGVHDILFIATDNGDPVGRDSLRFRVTVTNVDRPPVLQPLRDTAIDTTQTLSLTLSAVDPDGDPIAYSLANPPAGAALAGALFKWKPVAAQAGAHELRFIAIAAGLADTAEMRVTVTVPPPPPPNPAPIAYWSFDEGQGSRLNDSGAGGRFATVFGSPAWVDGVSGKALRFDGSAYAESEFAFPDMTEQTLTAWIRPDTLDASMTIIQESNTSLFRDNEITFEGPEARFMYRTRDADTKGVHYAPIPSLTKSRWYYLAATARADTVRLYVNGALRATTTGRGVFNLTGYHNRIQIGRKHDGGSDIRNYTRGILDEIKLYDKALTAEQILQDWERHRTKAGYPVLVLD